MDRHPQWMLPVLQSGGSRHAVAFMDVGKSQLVAAKTRQTVCHRFRRAIPANVVEQDHAVMALLESGEGLIAMHLDHGVKRRQLLREMLCVQIRFSADIRKPRAQ